MKILLAPDKFRGSLDAPQVCQAMAEGIKMVSPEIEVISLPMADGGEGTLDLLLWYAGGQKRTAKVHDPLGRLIYAQYGISADGKTAFIEMATASGLNLLKTDERNPLLTSTFGTGELIKTAVEAGVEQIILGIGGSATTDAGIGMAKALGWQFLDANNQEIEAIGGNLSLIKKIVPPLPSSKLPEIQVACDVTNPLYGINGAAHIYGPQKGADSEAVAILDMGLTDFAHLTGLPEDTFNGPGFGAAGGLGFGCVFFLNAKLKEGVKLLMDFCNFDKNLYNVDLIITGEGKIDNQTLQGKLIKGITNKAQQIPVAAICGTLAVTPQQMQEIGIFYANSILNKPQSLADALQVGYEGVRDATYYLVNMFYQISAIKS
ncbi:glycerate kinase [Emticicia sp. BO119]|uniref:glycerate kinase n=1 Tax=Emticicia sp. BO119 TaxID=2757768 RepID=UPI0015F0643F|nr:glycerate kinase [Emticicia sp. BO119]MBA4849249.1 glycerate kinase [Emticicia sp. BO119]